ncbi:MAG: dipicolinate synthase subunit DpsA [Clostridia bacterium]|nr:dipicolinate synthase subunit DpsA [Clostridia bacterium]
MMKSSTKTKKLLFVGGDLRQIRAINEASKLGNTVYALGFGGECTQKLWEDVRIIDDFSESDDTYHAVVLPLPYTTDGKSLNTPLFERKIMLTEVFENISPKNKVLAGRCDARIKTMAETHGITLVDYSCREELAMLNAVPTAEGAIQIAMEETPFTLHASNCLVIGCGRIGKILSKMLDGIGAKVTVSARKNRDLAYGMAMGFETVPISQLSGEIGKFDIIFNTVPSMILDFDLLSKISKKTLIIDLASKPGGVDFDEARRRGIKVIWALSLPGKVAPNTAGDIICSTIFNILEEMEMNG